MGLRMVLAIANDLITCPDLDTTLREAVEAARSKLGLERCAIFIEHDGFLYGTYGTDGHGHPTDEHDLRIPINKVWQDRFDRLTPEDAQWITVEDTHFEWDGKQAVPIGRGWITITRIQSEEGFRGLLINDANISKKQLNEVQQEVVSVFCTLLGRIIERQQAEESIRRTLAKEQELGEIKSRFIATISHEFRTPLAVIQTSSQLLKHYHDRLNDSQKAVYFDNIERQIQQITMLLDNVLTIGQANEVGLDCDVEPVDIVGFCTRLIHEATFVSNTRHEIVFSHTGHATCLVDEQLLRQTIMNLLTNAIKYSPQGSRIDVEVSCRDDEIVIHVKDQGIGISKEDQALVFEAFQRAKNVGAISGTGLGLSIVKRTVEAHGGRVELKSEEGVGSTFTVTIPLTTS